MSTEPERPEPDFRAYIERGGERVDVTYAVQDAYDVVINSLDFGSGFLSTEEVGNIRALGEAIGADRFDYQHDKCLRCGHDYERHYTDPHGHYPNSCYGDGRLQRRANGTYDSDCACKGFVRADL